MSFPGLYMNTLHALQMFWGDSGLVIVNTGDPTMTNNANVGGIASSGRVLVDVNDDLFPCDGWDEKLLEAIEKAGGLDRDFVVKVSHGEYHPELITHPIVSRSYFEKIGPVDSGYLGYGPDDELTVRAYQAGVVIDAPQIFFDHRDWRKEQRPKDAVDEWNNRPEVWKARGETLEKNLVGPKRKTLAVCTPGSPFPSRWLIQWDMLFAWLLARYEVKRIYAEANNIYQVREICYEATKASCNGGGPPDYVLWIDSDNPPNLEAVQWLLASMEAAESAGPEQAVDIIGGWYRMSDERGVVAAGGMSKLFSEQTVAASRSLIECEAGIGFGLLLMRGSVLWKLGAEAFWPAYVAGKKRPLTDDWSWCYRAREAGYKIWLHPKAWVEHLKLNAVPALAGSSQKEGKNNGDSIDSGSEPSDL
jgi:GT2 family glycosyltransferase